MEILILVCLALLLVITGFTLFIINMIEKDICHLIDIIDCTGVCIDDYRSPRP